MHTNKDKNGGGIKSADEQIWENEDEKSKKELRV